MSLRQFCRNRLANCLAKPSFTRYQNSRLLLPYRTYATSREESLKAKAAVGPFTFKAAALFLGVGSGLLLYFKSEKSKVEKLREQKEAERKKPESFGAEP
ncbi:hypothetical protein RMATCC62417_11975 [Rhizopus microsporus]|nr:hypothetical protein RMATCC62417_11975 [Rhizopus microsporus]